MQKIHNVVFDLGGVLVDLDIERCKAAFIGLGMSPVAEMLNPYYPAEIFGLLERGDISAHEACERMRTLCNRPDVSDEQIAEAYAQFLTGIPVEKLRMVKALREAGIKTYVLSNNNPLVMPFIRQMFCADSQTMDDYFNHIYLSYELHELKPSPEIFHKTIRHSGIRPEESLFIDDGQKNIDTARELGFETYMPAPFEDFSHLFDPILK